jgi:signal transduction histidine kinase/CheY-like chemotaxis protein
MSAAAPLDRGTSRLTWLYIAALTAVALLSLAGQLLVQQALHRQRGDSTIVNIAGRQRMLSQKLTKAALAFQHATSPEQRSLLRHEIETTLALWQRSHDGLQQGDESLQLTGATSTAVREQFARLTPIFDEMVTAAQQLISTADEPRRQVLLETLLRQEPLFLQAMDDVVFQMDREAQARVARLQRMEWLLLSLTLVVLVAEGIVVFRPAVARIRQAGHDLVESRRQLQIAKEAAESANEQKTRFLANLSHELRNPLHAILGNTELALHSSLSPDNQSHLETVDAAARSLLSLVNDLLDLACLQDGKLRVQCAPVDLMALGRRSVAMLEPQAEQKGLRISAEFSADKLPVETDPLRVQQVLLNLLGNAVKFTDQGIVSLHIGRREHGVRIEVRDTGPGIPPEQQERIFAAFTQVDASTKREFAGVGLGLAITAGLVELLQGTLGVISKPGQGSCFWVELPLPVAEFQEPLAVQLPGSPDESKLHILVADDDAINRKLLTDFLGMLGHRVTVASDGQQAWECARSTRFDLLLIDWHMPQLDGLELTQRIRQRETEKKFGKVPIIAVTAAGLISNADLARQAGIDVILTKPVGLDDLRQVLRFKHGSSSSPGSASSQVTAQRWAASLSRLQGRHDLFRDLAVMMRETLPQQVQQLSAEIDRQDWRNAARTAHLLRGQAANFDALELMEAASQLEEAALAGDASACDRMVREVQKLAGHLTAELEPIR